MEKVLSKFHFIFRHFAYLFDDRENDDWLILDHPIHVFQREHWDCGIACCAMVLKWLNIPLEELYQHDIATRKSPLWTIDLFLFLIEHSVNADMYTITLGFDTHHSNYDWYLDNFNSETSTSVSDINSRYVAAMERGLPIYTRSLSTEEIQKLLCDESLCIAIALVNANALYHHVSDEPSSENSRFSGHYIILLGFDHSKREYRYLNPDRTPEVQVMHEDLFETARRHPGTDEDIIFCYQPLQLECTNN